MSFLKTARQGYGGHIRNNYTLWISIQNHGPIVQVFKAGRAATARKGLFLKIGGSSEIRETRKAPQYRDLPARWLCSRFRLDADVVLHHPCCCSASFDTADLFYDRKSSIVFAAILAEVVPSTLLDASSKILNVSFPSKIVSFCGWCCHSQDFPGCLNYQLRHHRY